MRSSTCANCAATNASRANGVWEDDDQQPKASDVQIGVLGLGIMGKDAVAKLKALGFKVAGWSASPKSLPDVACFSGADGLKRLLAQTDMLVVLLPLTEATRGIINASLLSQLNQDGPLGGPILINAGRGGLQVEADILAALDSGALKGASLDVFEREPLPKGFTALVASRGLCQPAQCGNLLAQSDRRARRPADRGLRTRRAALPCGRSPPRLLSQDVRRADA